MIKYNLSHIVLTDNLIYITRKGEPVRIFPGREGLHFMEVAFVGEGRNEHILLELNYGHRNREYFRVPKCRWHEIVSWMRSTGFSVHERQTWIAIANTGDIDTADLDNDGTETYVIVRWKDGGLDIFNPSIATKLGFPIREELCQD